MELSKTARASMIKTTTTPKVLAHAWVLGRPCKARKPDFTLYTEDQIKLAQERGDLHIVRTSTVTGR